MKTRTFALVVGLCLALLPLLGQPADSVNTVSAQATVTEIEPNNNKAQAQLLRLAAGETVVVEGRVGPNDGGSLVSELLRLETPFGNPLFTPPTEILPRDPIEDWFAIDVRGSLEYSVELQWPDGTANLSNWTLGDIAAQIYSDQLVSIHVASTPTGRPEIEPNRIYYTYDDRRSEVQGGRLTIPATSRYYVTVSNTGTGSQQPVSYRLVLTSPRRGTTRTVLDAVRGPTVANPVVPADVGANRMRVVQRLTPTEYPARLDEVGLVQFDIEGQQVLNESLDLIVLVDPQGTGNPAAARPVLTRRVRIQALNALNSYSVRDANIVVQSGDIYAGFEVPETGLGLHLPFDLDKAGYGRSFVSVDGGRTYRYISLISFDKLIPLVGNAVIETALTINPRPGKHADAPEPTRVRTNLPIIPAPVKSVSLVDVN
ncbi:MAG: hypothetical protein NZ823_13215 [Blastocatellia bacterium]|nr:hypothetical protein [Blastocatellia bacterium]